MTEAVEVPRADPQDCRQTTESHSLRRSSKAVEGFSEPVSQRGMVSRPRQLLRLWEF